MVMDSGDVAGIEWADKRKGQGVEPLAPTSTSSARLLGGLPDVCPYYDAGLGEESTQRF